MRAVWRVYQLSCCGTSLLRVECKQMSLRSPGLHRTQTPNRLMWTCIFEQQSSGWAPIGSVPETTNGTLPKWKKQNKQHNHLNDQNTPSSAASVAGKRHFLSTWTSSRTPSLLQYSNADEEFWSKSIVSPPRVSIATKLWLRTIELKKTGWTWSPTATY